MSFVKEAALDLKDGLINGPWAERVLAGLMILGIVLVTALVGYLVFYVADSVSTDISTDNGIVIQKTYYPPHTDILPAGMILVPWYYPAIFKLTLKLKDGCGSIDVDQGFYSHINEGESLETTYSHGRISGSIYVKSAIKK